MNESDKFTATTIRILQAMSRATASDIKKAYIYLDAFLEKILKIPSEQICQKSELFNCAILIYNYYR